jgi:hypothetical protein
MSDSSDTEKVYSIFRAMLVKRAILKRYTAFSVSPTHKFPPNTKVSISENEDKTDDSK